MDKEYKGKKQSQAVDTTPIWKNKIKEQTLWYQKKKKKKTQLHLWEIKARKIQTIKSNQVKSKVLPFLVLSSVAWNRQRAQSPRVCLASEEVLSETLPCSIPWAMGNSRTGYLRKNLSSAVIGKKKKKKKKRKDRCLSLGCHDKMGFPETREICCLTVWEAGKSKIKVPAGFSSWQGLFSWLADGYLLSMS